MSSSELYLAKESANEVCTSHFVQFYNDDRFLSSALSEFVRIGLKRDEAAVLICTEKHWNQFRSDISRSGLSIDFDKYLQLGQIVFVDAEDALRKIVVDEVLSHEKFLNLVEESLKVCRRSYKRVRFFGELVDLLCMQSKFDAAMELEGFWNQLLNKNDDLSLMCGYSQNHVPDTLDSRSINVRRICAAHARVIGGEDANLRTTEDDLIYRLGGLELRALSSDMNNDKEAALKTELDKCRKQILQLGKLSILGELSAGVAHEINNPLTIVMARAEMMLRDLEVKKACDENEVVKLRNNFAAIHEASIRIQKIIRNVLDFSQPRKAKICEFSMKEAIESSISFVSERFKSRGIEIVREFESDFFVSGDQIQIEQVIINLMCNARDALSAVSEEGFSPSVTLGLKSLPDDRIEFSITDNGIGMDERTKEQLFVPFYTTKDVGEGTGLGLSISHGIIKDHQGSILVSSAPMNGTTFRISLPNAEVSKIFAV